MSRVHRWLSRVRSDARAGGWIHALCRGSNLVFERLVYARESELLIERDLAQPLPMGRCTDLVVEEIGHSHLPLLEEFGRVHTSAADTRKLLAYQRCGARGHLALQNDQMIGYAWWMSARDAPRSPHPALARLGLALGEDDVCSFDLFLAPVYRGGDRARAFHARHLTNLREMGFRRALGWVSESNLSARVLHRTLGRKEIGGCTARMLLATLMIAPTGIFVRNGPRSPTPFDFRPLVLLARRPQS